MPEAACQFQVILIREGGLMPHLSTNSVPFDLIRFISLLQLFPLGLVLEDLGLEPWTVLRHSQDCIQMQQQQIQHQLDMATITRILRTDSMRQVLEE